MKVFGIASQRRTAPTPSLESRFRLNSGRRRRFPEPSVVERGVDEAAAVAADQLLAAAAAAAAADADAKLCTTGSC